MTFRVTFDFVKLWWSGSWALLTFEVRDDTESSVHRSGISLGGQVVVWPERRTEYIHTSASATLSGTSPRDGVLVGSVGGSLGERLGGGRHEDWVSRDVCIYFRQGWRQINKAFLRHIQDGVRSLLRSNFLLGPRYRRPVDCTDFCFHLGCPDSYQDAAPPTDSDWQAKGCPQMPFYFFIFFVFSSFLLFPPYSHPERHHTPQPSEVSFQHLCLMCNFLHPNGLRLTHTHMHRINYFRMGPLFLLWSFGLVSSW